MNIRGLGIALWMNCASPHRAGLPTFSVYFEDYLFNTPAAPMNAVVAPLCIVGGSFVYCAFSFTFI